MKPAFLSTAFFLCSNFVFCQSPSFAYDTIMVNLLITDYEGKPIETTVKIEQMGEKKSSALKTNSKGRGTCRLATAYKYVIKIEGSADNYEYEIPDIALSPVELVFKFHFDGKKENR
jgi:hypothetical protein